MKSSNNVTAEQWDEVCERVGWWKSGRRCEAHGSTTYPQSCKWGYSWGFESHDIPCPLVTDERLMQVLRAILSRGIAEIGRGKDRMDRQNWIIDFDGSIYRAATFDAVIIHTYLALPKET